MGFSKGETGLGCLLWGRWRLSEAQHSGVCVVFQCGDALSLWFPQFISLTRPLDSHLEHVDFSSLLRCLSFEQILQLFASAVLERRIIFLAEGLRWVQPLSNSPELTGILGVKGTVESPRRESGCRTRVLTLRPASLDLH